MAALESSLPPGAMLFMLPLVVSSPRAAPCSGADEYEHLRPYLHARRLRFSFGADKGRARESWQIEAASRPPAQMVADLERYGFAGIRSIAGRTHGKRPTSSPLWRQPGDASTLSHTAGDYVFVPLHPAAVPSLPGHTRVVGVAP